MHHQDYRCALPDRLDVLEVEDVAVIGLNAELLVAEAVFFDDLLAVVGSVVEAD